MALRRESVVYKVKTTVGVKVSPKEKEHVFRAKVDARWACRRMNPSLSTFSTKSGCGWVGKEKVKKVLRETVRPK